MLSYETNRIVWGKTMDAKTFILIISSAGVSALVTGAFEIIKHFIEHREVKRDREYKREDDFIKNKEAAYLAALDRLVQIRKAMEYTYENVQSDENLKNEYLRNESEFRKEAARIRLYSSDAIYSMYSTLASYSRFAYVLKGGKRLIENRKWAYDAQVIRLSRLMQEDLGIRNFSEKNNEIVECPECGSKHDAFRQCPKCGMTRQQLEERIVEINRQILNDVQPR